MSEVPIGMKCTDCGCCLAAVKAGDDWLCWDCDANQPCKVKREAAQPKPEPKPYTPAAPIALPPTVVEPKENPVTVTSARTSKARISDDIRNAIIAADPTISHSTLAREHGISDVTVYTIRKQAGISLVKGARAAKPKKAAKAKPAKKRTPVTPTLKVPLPTPSAKISVSIDIDEDIAAGLWAKFSLEDKAVAIRSVLMAQLENA